MVSFSCENCNETVKKNKLSQHQRQCYGAYFTCIDCSITFYNNEHVSHTSCISEAEKYEKGLFKGKKKPQQQNQNKNQNRNQNNKNDQDNDKTEKRSKEPKVEKKEVGGKSSSNQAGEFKLSKYIKKDSTNLYKVLKLAKKDQKKENSDLLKLIKVKLNDDGSINISV